MTDILTRQEDAEVAVAPIKPPPTSGESGLMSVVMPPALLGLVLLGLWYFVSYVVLDPKKRFLMPPPQDIVKDGFFTDGVWQHQLTSLWNTTYVATQGLLISVLIGFALAVIMSQSRSLENAIFPFAVVLQAVPVLALVPVIGFWVGFGNSARVIVCVLISVFPIILNTLFGLQSADRGLHDLFTLHGVSRWTRLRKLMFPAAMPAIFAGLRISAGLSVIGAIVGDMFFGQGKVGIGQDLKNYARNLKGEELFAAVALACMFGVAVFLFFGWLRDRMISKWYDSATN